MRYEILILEDDYEAVNKSFESFGALKSEILNLDTYGVGGGYNPWDGVEFGTPPWCHKEGLKALLATSESWPQFRDGCKAVFGKCLAHTPKGVAIESDIGLDESWVTFISVVEEG